MYTFDDLKKDFQNYDTCRDDTNTLIVGRFFLRRSGDISIHAVAFELDQSCVTVSCNVAKKRTPEQMKSFLDGVL